MTIETNTKFLQSITKTGARTLRHPAPTQTEVPSGSTRHERAWRTRYVRAAHERHAPRFEEADAGYLPAGGYEDWIIASDLHIDHDQYQRRPVEAHIRRIAREFDPDLFGRLVVSHRANGSYYVIDGQHRLSAIAKMGWLDQRLPCIVYEDLSIEREASLFVLTQDNRRPIHAVDRYRARLVAGDPLTLEIEAALQRHGFQVTKGTARNAIQAVSALVQVAQGKPGDLDAVLSVLRAAWDGEASALNSSMILGIAAFRQRYRDRYDHERLVSILQTIAPPKLLADARNGVSLSTDYHSLRYRVAVMIANRYNQRLTTRRLPPWERAIDDDRQAEPEMVTA